MAVLGPDDSPVRHDPKWKSCCAELGIEFPTYSNAQKVSFLFAGIGGPDRAIMEGDWPVEPVNIVEKRPDACAVLRRLPGHVVWPTTIEECPPQTLDSSDGCIGTAPCITFSKAGNGENFFAYSGSLFIRQLEAIKELAQRKDRPLKWVLLENVWHIMSVNSTTKKRPWDFVTEWWRNNMPGWSCLMPWKVNAEE